ncbi:MAG: sodium:solute symporter family protein [Clostridiales bacterium]|nr:sodium:solute symporter family protein [Clostridiales bacterium]
MDKNFILYFIILAIYIGIMVFIAYYSRKKSNTLNSFYLADRGIGPWMTAFAYGTTYFSSVIIIGYAGKLGVLFGLGAVWIGVGNAILGTLLPWLFLAKPTKYYTEKYQIKTMPQFFEKRYNDKNIKLVTGLIVALLLIPYSASVYQGLGALFAAVFSLGGKSADNVFIICVLVLAGITALYVFFGGYFATALSDFVQGFIMLFGIICFVAVVYNNQYIDGIGNAFTRLSALDKSFFPSSGKSVFMLICLILLTSIGPWGLPQTIHKFYAVKDNNSIKRGTIISTGFCAVIGISAYLAGATSILFGDAINYSSLVATGSFDDIMPAMMTTVLPPILIGVMIILVLSASMSTLASLSLSSSGAITIDIYQGYIRKDAPDKKVNLITRVVSVIMIMLSALIAIFKPIGIVELMSISWGTLAGCLLGPYVLGLRFRKMNKYGAWASVIGTIIITATFVGLGFAPKFENSIVFGIKNSPVIGVICMTYSVIITPIVSLITNKLYKLEIPEKENYKDFVFNK